MKGLFLFITLCLALASLCMCVPSRKRLPMLTKQEGGNNETKTSCQEKGTQYFCEGCLSTYVPFPACSYVDICCNGDEGCRFCMKHTGKRSWCSAEDECKTWERSLDIDWWCDCTNTTQVWYRIRRHFHATLDSRLCSPCISKWSNDIPSIILWPSPTTSPQMQHLIFKSFQLISFSIIHNSPVNFFRLRLGPSSNNVSDTVPPFLISQLRFKSLETNVAFHP